MNIIRYLNDNAKEIPDKPAVIATDNSITFLELRDLTFCLANGLKQFGLKKNAKIAVCLPNTPEYILSYLAVYSLGGIIVPLDFMFTQSELLNLLNHSESEVLITKERRDIDLRKLKQNSRLEYIILLNEQDSELMDPVRKEATNRSGFSNWVNFRNLIKENSPEEPQIEILDSDYSTIFYTSGSTGHPKGVLLNYKHLDAPVKACEHLVHLTRQDIVFNAMPLSHAAGWVFFMDMLYFGMTMVLQERFLPLECLKKIERYKVTFLCLVPSMYIAMLSLKEFKKFDLSSLRYVVVFGAPSSPVLLRRFHQICPNAHLLNGWGMTETSPPNIVLPLDSNRIESIGKPAPWIEVKIFNEDDREVGIGQIGELVIRSWVVMEGYYREPELTSKVIRNNWFHTGDLARMDSEGLLYIVGRKKEMIKVAGEIVYAPEVEEVIHRHPKVNEVAVVGVSDKLRGEVPKAFLVLKKEEKLTEDELRFFCRQHLAHFKIPHYYEFRDSLPKTRSGKIDKANLVQ